MYTVHIRNSVNLYGIAMASHGLEPFGCRGSWGSLNMREEGTTLGCEMRGIDTSEDVVVRFL